MPNNIYSLAAAITWCVVSLLACFNAVDVFELDGHYAPLAKIILTVCCVLMFRFWLRYERTSKKEYLQSGSCLLIVVLPFVLVGIDNKFMDIFEYYTWTKELAAPVMTIGVVIGAVVAILLDNRHDRNFPEKKGK